MSELCLNILCPPAAEEKLLDLLLMSSFATVFTSMATSAHGLGHDQLDQMEQVMGRARATHVQVIVPESKKAALLGELRSQFAGSSLRYWVFPVLESGEIS